MPHVTARVITYMDFQVAPFETLQWTLQVDPQMVSQVALQLAPLGGFRNFSPSGAPSVPANVPSYTAAKHSSTVVSHSAPCPVAVPGFPTTPYDASSVPLDGCGSHPEPAVHCASRCKL